MINKRRLGIFLILAFSLFSSFSLGFVSGAVKYEGAYVLDNSEDLWYCNQNSGCTEVSTQISTSVSTTAERKVAASTDGGVYAIDNANDVWYCNRTSCLKISSQITSSIPSYAFHASNDNGVYATGGDEKIWYCNKDIGCYQVGKVTGSSVGIYFEKKITGIEGYYVLDNSKNVWLCNTTNCTGLGGVTGTVSYGTIDSSSLGGLYLLQNNEEVWYCDKSSGCLGISSAINVSASADRRVAADFLGGFYVLDSREDVWYCNRTSAYGCDKISINQIPATGNGRIKASASGGAYVLDDVEDLWYCNAVPISGNKWGGNCNLVSNAIDTNVGNERIASDSLGGVYIIDDSEDVWYCDNSKCSEISSAIDTAVSPTKIVSYNYKIGDFFSRELLLSFIGPTPADNSKVLNSFIVNVSASEKVSSCKLVLLEHLPKTCLNFPGPGFCPGGMDDIIANGTDSSGCLTYTCTSGQSSSGVGGVESGFVGFYAIYDMNIFNREAGIDNSTASLLVENLPTGIYNYYTTCSESQAGVSNKNLIPMMTSNTAPYGVVNASSYYAYYYPWKAFDGADIKAGWLGPLNTDNQWVQYDFGDGNQKKAVSFYLSRRYGSAFSSSIYEGTKGFYINASNDGSSWTTIYNGEFGGTEQNKTISISNPNYYRYYRIFAYSHYVNGAGNWYVGFQEIKMFGVDETSFSQTEIRVINFTSSLSSLTRAIWRDMNGKEINRSDLNDLVTLKVVGQNLENQEINYTVYKSLWYWFDKKIATNSSSGYTTLKMTESGKYYFYATIPNNKPLNSSYLDVLVGGNNDKTKISIISPACGNNYTLNDSLSFVVNISDSDDFVSGYFFLDGQKVAISSNQQTGSFVLNTSGNIHIVANVTNERGEFARAISNIMVINPAINAVYLAACISKPEDTMSLDGSTNVTFDASQSKGINYTGSQIAIPTSNINFNWTFYEVSGNPIYSGKYEGRGVASFNYSFPAGKYSALLEISS